MIPSNKKKRDQFIAELKSNKLDGELEEIKQMTIEQLSYVNPLRMKKS